MTDFLKDYGSLILTAIAGFIMLFWRAFCLVKQSELMNQRLEVLEKHFDKLEMKLDKILDDRQ